jgi:hypothetical protein
VQRISANAKLRGQLVRGAFANLDFEGIAVASLVEGPGLSNRP